MKKKILITGAGGFIGSFIVEEALRRQYDTWAGVRPSTGREYLQDPDIRFIQLHYADKEQLKRQLLEQHGQTGRWDCIIWNLGATKCRQPQDFDTINYGFLRNFVEALIETRTVPGQFIMTSSLGAWGAGDEKNYTPIRPDDPPAPETRYGKSKLRAEEYLRSLPGFPYVIFRPTGVYGPREKDYFLMMKTIACGVDFAAGYRRQALTFIYVKDLVKAMFLAIDKGVVRRAYFVSDGAVYAPSDFRRYVRQALHKRFVLPLHLPLWILRAVCYSAAFIAARRGRTSTLNPDKYRILKQRNWICDTTDLQTELGFTPDYPLEKGIREAVQWYREAGWL